MPTRIASGFVGVGETVADGTTDAAGVVTSGFTGAGDTATDAAGMWADTVTAGSLAAGDAATDAASTWWDYQRAMTYGSWSVIGDTTSSAASRTVDTAVDVGLDGLELLGTGAAEGLSALLSGLLSSPLVALLLALGAAYLLSQIVDGFQGGAPAA